MAVISGPHTRVLLDGVEISSSVRSLSIDAPADGFWTTMLELIVTPEIEHANGICTVHLATRDAPRSDRTGSRARGIRLRTT